MNNFNVTLDIYKNKTVLQIKSILHILYVNTNNFNKLND